MTVARYVRQLRQSGSHPSSESLNDLPGRGPAPAIQILDQPPLTARRAAWLVIKPMMKLTSVEENRLARLSEHPALSVAINLTQSFLSLVRHRLPQNLDLWLEQAKSSSYKLFQSFATGIKDDYDAVKAGVTLEVSNGQVEGQNNRVKMLKRQMYGRAGLGLLARRLILTS
jgi:transposase